MRCGLRESVAMVRAVLEMGADIDMFVHYVPMISTTLISKYTAVGLAVMHQNRDVLACLHEAGADLRRARWGTSSSESPPAPHVPSKVLEASEELNFSALQQLVSTKFSYIDGDGIEHLTDCLPYLLGSAPIDDQMGCGRYTILALQTLAFHGRRAIPVFEKLVESGFDIKALARPGPWAAIWNNEPPSNIILAAAASSSDKKLLQYLVKAGLSATANGVRKIGTIVEGMSDDGVSFSSISEQCSSQSGVERARGANKALSGPESESAMLLKVCCDFCRKVGKVNLCSRCKKARYCSKTCQNSHWKASNGHKAECRAVSTKPRVKKGKAVTGAGES